ncbi:hypothetical protein C8F01DRAFT_505839, partial [Mycena amicta]
NKRPRNHACYHCRYRKIRCDGQRPVCGQCRIREEDCEYTDNYSRSRAEILEEDISRIQFRIHQLEHPEEANADVVLYHPYGAGPQPAGYAQMPATSSSTTLHPDVSMQPGILTSDALWNAEEPPADVVENLIDIFLASAPAFGFFLNPERFRNSALLSLPLNHAARPTSALLAAVCLAGISMSPSPSLKMHENAFRARAVSSVSSVLAGLHPKRVLYALQAEIVLAWYFYGAGKLVEGLYHAATAVSLGVTSGIFAASHDHGQTAADVDAVSDQERVDACWATVVLDRTWAVVMNSLPNWTDSIATSWPGVTASRNTNSTDTVAEFIAHGHTATLPKDLLAKAAVLWEAASGLITRSDWKPGSPNDTVEAQVFFRQFFEIDARIESLRNSHGYLNSDLSAVDKQVDFLGRSMAHAAAIQLHRPFTNLTAQEQSQARGRCVDAAQAILHLARNAAATNDSAQQVYFSPIIAPIWATACRVFLDLMGMNKTDHELRREFEYGFTAMRTHSGSSLLMQYHLEKINEQYDALLGPWSAA